MPPCSFCHGDYGDHLGGRCPHVPDRQYKRIDSGLIMLEKIIIVVIAVVIVAFLLRWAYTEYYISTHCTTVLGTRVCQ